MGKKLSKVLLSILVAVILLGASALTSSCVTGGGKEIKIGALLDISGVAADAGQQFLKGFEDWVSYANENHLLHGGIKLRLVSYDTKYQPARTAAGYDSLKAQGVKMIWGFATQDAEILEDDCKADKIPFYVTGATDRLLQDPEGYIFGTSARYEDHVDAFLRWLVETGWDYTGTGRNPKIAAFGWDNTLGLAFTGGAERYCTDPTYVSKYSSDINKLDWKGKYVVPTGTLTWSAVVGWAKGIQPDYLIVGVVGAAFVSFLNEMDTQGFDTTLVLHDATTTFWPTVIHAMAPYPTRTALLNGTLYYCGYTWSTEDYPLPNLAEQIMNLYRPDEADDILLEPSYRGALYTALCATEVFSRVLEETKVDEEYDVNEVTGERLWAQTVGLDLTQDNALSILPDIVNVNEPMKFTSTRHMLVTHARLFEWSNALGDFQVKSVSSSYPDGFIPCPKWD